MIRRTAYLTAPIGCFEDSENVGRSRNDQGILVSLTVEDGLILAAEQEATRVILETEIMQRWLPLFAQMMDSVVLLLTFGMKLESLALLLLFLIYLLSC
jgi:hypothetical protein